MNRHNNNKYTMIWSLPLIFLIGCGQTAEFLDTPIRPTSNQSTSEECFEFIDDIGMIIDYKCNSIKDVIIPKQINGVIVTSIRGGGG